MVMDGMSADRGDTAPGRGADLRRRQPRVPPTRFASPSARVLDLGDDVLDLLGSCVEQFPIQALVGMASLRPVGEIETNTPPADRDFDGWWWRQLFVEEQVLEAIPPELGRIVERRGRHKESGRYPGPPEQWQ